MKFAVCLSVLGSPGDRFVPSGYKEPKSPMQMLNEAGKIEGIEGIEVLEGSLLNESNLEEMERRLKELNLIPCLVMADTFCQPKWGRGSLSSSDERMRKEAIREIKKTIDLAKKIDCKNIGIWLGQDGFDYCFQVDYRKAWGRIIEGIKECADYKPEIKVCIEYKIKEPRTHIFLGTVGKMLFLIEQVSRENVGVILDVGHLFNAYENPAESVVLLKEFGDRLFHVHLNDNWGLWDDDLAACSLHTIEYLEFLYWLKEIEYQGWYSLDLAPCREDGVKSATESIEWIKGLSRLLEKVGYEKLRDAIERQEPIESLSLIRKALFP